MSITVGDEAPDVELTTAGGTSRLSENRGHWVVLYFYPADDTPGCTAEACSFRDAYEEFTDAGAIVIGVSGDSLEKHERFAERYDLPFALVSDHDGALRRAFGVKKSMGIFEGRVTFVIDPKGVVQKVFSSQIRATAHIGEALTAIRGT
jgi:peroxiredoxin Q/BCP